MRSEMAEQVKHLLAVLHGGGLLSVGLSQLGLESLYSCALVGFAIANSRQDADEVLDLLFFHDQVPGEFPQRGLEDVWRIGHMLIRGGTSIVLLPILGLVVAVGSSVCTSPSARGGGSVRVHVRLALDDPVGVAGLYIAQRGEHLGGKLLLAVSHSIFHAQHGQRYIIVAVLELGEAICHGQSLRRAAVG